jgi:regulatory protein
MDARNKPTDRTKKPLDAAKLDELALAYVARFATSKGKLARYLSRKLSESKWIDAQNGEEAIAAAIEKMERLKYLDDQQYAQMKSGAMMRRGLGINRVKAQLRFDGVSDDDRERALAIDGKDAVLAALRFAQRKRLGPFGAETLSDRAQYEKKVAAFLRAGHPMRLAREILSMDPMDAPDVMDIADQIESF